MNQYYLKKKIVPVYFSEDKIGSKQNIGNILICYFSYVKKY